MNKELIQLAIDALENTKKLEHLVDQNLRNRAIKELTKALSTKEEVKEPLAWKSTTPPTHHTLLILGIVSSQQLFRNGMCHYDVPWVHLW